ncbi:TolC family protein [Pseudomonas sp. EL_65y_Pfl2_R95]|uniref:TolC family protein n=1 Tax=Pseudomonas sp. EL_65y_Pfl2_R95 TaxID=3088698 RepID=UPI0030DAD26F
MTIDCGCLNRWAFAALMGCPLFAAAAEPVLFEAPSFSDVDVMTLRNAVLRAFGHDPLIAKMTAQVGIAQALIDEAESAWQPQISLQSGLGGSDKQDADNDYSDTHYGLSVTQLVYDFGKTQNAVLRQRSVKKGAIYHLQQALGDVAKATADTYLLIKRYAALKQAAEQGVTSLEAVEAIAKVRASSGLSSSSDYLQAQSRIATMQSQVEQFHTLRKTAIAQLEVLTGVRARRFMPPPQALNKQAMQVGAIDYSLIGAVRKAMADSAAASMRIEENKAGYLPTIKLQAGRNRYENNHDAYWDNQLYLNLDVPLYTGGAVSARVAQAVGAKQSAEQSIHQVKFDVLSRAAVAHSNYTGSHSRYAVSAHQVDIATVARQVNLDEYRLSRRTVNDLMTVEQDLYQAHLALANADFDGWDAAVAYAAAVDRLVDLLKIHRTEPSGTLPDI